MSSATHCSIRRGGSIAADDTKRSITGCMADALEDLDERGVDPFGREFAGPVVTKLVLGEVGGEGAQRGP